VPDTNEKIKVIKQTNEDVRIYYYSIFNSKSNLTTIYYDETKFIWVSTGTEYYAEGEISKKDYGSRKFSKVPSNWDVEQTWLIEER
jgi:hypothetical protein